MAAGDIHIKCADYLNKAFEGWEKESNRPIFNKET